VEVINNASSFYSREERRSKKGDHQTPTYKIKAGAFRAAKSVTVNIAHPSQLKTCITAHSSRNIVILTLYITDAR
jgi:hypothetical protein